MTLTRSGAVQTILDLEDSGSPALDVRLPGSPIPYWAQMRTQFATMLNEPEVGGTQLRAPRSLPAMVSRLARSGLPDRSDAMHWRGQRDVVFLVGGDTRYRRGDRAGNWLVDAYSEALGPRAFVLQRPSLASPFGPPAFEATRSLDPALARAQARAAMRWRASSGTRSRISELVTEFARLLGIEDDPRLRTLINSAVWEERVRPHVDAAFSRLLDELRPRAVIYEDASYGNAHASLVAIARERGIVVAEPQHGWIGPSHLAYNHGAVGRRPDHALALPQVLLTFGELWGNGVAFPGRIVPVGKPHLEARQAESPVPGDRAREVLIVSSVADAAATLEFVTRLRSALPTDWSMRFRPHPTERAALAVRYPGLTRLPGLVIDERTDVYDSLAACRIVVGVASTVLYEAAAFDCQVFVRDSRYLPYMIGDLFGTPLGESDDVDRVVRAAAASPSAEDGRPRVDVDRLWKSDAVGGFTRWLAEATA